MNFDNISALPDAFYAHIYQDIDLMNMDTPNNNIRNGTGETRTQT